MRVRPHHRSRPVQLPGVAGTARLDRRTLPLARRLRPGEIAVIDHLDLDRASAEALLAARPAAVVNAASSISGRYPTPGPQLLLAAGVILLDDVGPEIFTAVRDGQRLRIDGAVLYADGGSEPVQVGAGQRQTPESVRRLTEQAQTGVSAQLEAFAAGTLQGLRRDRDLLLDGVGVPPVRVRFAGRHTVVVVRAYDYRRELAALRTYLREVRPALVGVDAGGDALLDAGHRPDLLVGDPDRMSQRCLRSGAEVVVTTGGTTRLDRLERLGVAGVAFPFTGPAEDAALLLADVHGAAAVVTVGTHLSLVDLLDASRSGTASSFLVRLRVGPKLLDAKAVAVLYRHRTATWQLALLLVAGLLAVLVAVALTPAGAQWGQALLEWLRGLGFPWLTD